MAFRRTENPQYSQSNQSDIVAMHTVEEYQQELREENLNTLRKLQEEYTKAQAKLELSLAESNLKKEQERRLKVEKALAEYRKSLILNNVKDEDKLRAELERARKRLEVTEEAKATAERFYAQRKQLKELRESQMESTKATFQALFTSDFPQAFKQLFTTKAGIGGLLTSVIEGTIKKFGEQINSTISSYAKYQDVVNTRLQGTSTTFLSATSKLSSALGTSPYLKTQTLYENLQKFTDMGVAFNIESRTFLATISDKIALSFDAMDKTLTNIIKLQQADSTAARLGIEAALTRFLNATFEDSSYLMNSYKNVTSSLLDATSQMTADNAIKFEFVVQKWIGALSSVGLSENTVNKLANSINALASGQFESFASDEGMRNLFTMAASNIGQDIGETFTKGFKEDVSDLNALMQSVVTSMQSLAKESNNLVRAQSASIFGLSLQDLTAALNLSNKENVDVMKAVSEAMMDYSSAIEELSYQLRDEMPTRISLVSKVDTLIDNAKFGLGLGIARSPITQATWKFADFLENITGGIPVQLGPISTSVESLAKIALIGGSAAQLAASAIKGLSVAGDMSSALASLGISADKLTTLGKITPIERGLTKSTSVTIGTESLQDFNQLTLETRQDLLKQQEEEELSGKTPYAYLINTFEPRFSGITSIVDYRLQQIVELLGGEATNITSMSSKSIGQNVVTSSPIKEDKTEVYDSIVSNIDNNVQHIYDTLINIQNRLDSLEFRDIL